MTATRIGSVDLCLVTLLTAGLAALAPRTEPPPVAAMPDPSPEQLTEPQRETQALLDSCSDPAVRTVVVRGRITSLEPSMTATFHIRLADLPSRYEARTGTDGRFEVRIPVADLQGTDLCDLPMRGTRPAFSFADGNMSVRFQLYSEK